MRDTKLEANSQHACVITSIFHAKPH